MHLSLINSQSEYAKGFLQSRGRRGLMTVYDFCHVVEMACGTGGDKEEDSRSKRVLQVTFWQ